MPPVTNPVVLVTVSVTALVVAPCDTCSVLPVPRLDAREKVTVVAVTTRLAVVDFVTPAEVPVMVTEVVPDAVFGNV